jgi:hypothetical protein
MQHISVEQEEEYEEMIKELRAQLAEAEKESERLRNELQEAQRVWDHCQGMYMASMPIADQSALLSICFSARFRIKYACYPLQYDVTCPTLRIVCPLPVLVHIRGNPRLLKVFSFKNNHRRNRASIGTNTF